MKKTCPVSLTALACFVVFALTGLFAFDAQQRASTTVHEDTELVQGREAAVIGFPGSDDAESSGRIRIRGSASLSQTNEPVIYVDGVRIDRWAVEPNGQELREAAISARRAKEVVDARVEAQLDALASQLDNLANRLDEASLWINGEQELDMVESWETLEQLRAPSEFVTQLRDLTLNDLPAKIER